MFLRFFLSNQPFVLFLLLPIGITFYALNYYFGYHAIEPLVDMGLWGKTSWLSEWWVMPLTGLVIGITALQLNYLFNRHEFLERNNYGPSLFYITMMSFSHSFYQLDGLLLSQVCWLQVIYLLFETRPGDDNRKEIFNAAFFVGLSATFHPPTIGFLLILWFSLWSLKPLSFREWILSLIGFSIPLINASMYWWFSGHSIDMSLLTNSIIVEHEAIVFYLTSGLIAVLFVLSLIGVQIRRQKSSIRFKKMNRSLLWVLFGGLVLGGVQLILYRQIEWFNFIFISLSFFFTFAFIHRFWQAIASFFFYTTFVLAIVKYFLYSHLLV